MRRVLQRQQGQGQGKGDGAPALQGGTAQGTREGATGHVGPGEGTSYGMSKAGMHGDGPWAEASTRERARARDARSGGCKLIQRSQKW